MRGLNEKYIFEEKRRIREIVFNEKMQSCHKSPVNQRPEIRIHARTDLHTEIIHSHGAPLLVDQGTYQALVPNWKGIIHL